MSRPAGPTPGHGSPEGPQLALPGMCETHVWPRSCSRPVLAPPAAARLPAAWLRWALAEPSAEPAPSGAGPWLRVGAAGAARVWLGAHRAPGYFEALWIPPHETGVAGLRVLWARRWAIPQLLDSLVAVRSCLEHLLGPTGRWGAAVPGPVAPRVVALLSDAVRAQRRAGPLHLARALAASNERGTSPADLALLPDSAGLLRLPQYEGWTLPTPPPGAVAELRGLLRQHTSGRGQPATTCSDTKVAATVTAWLRWCETSDLRGQWSEALRHGAAIHWRCAQPRLAAWCAAAAWALEGGLALSDHPLLRAAGDRALRRCPCAAETGAHRRRPAAPADGAPGVLSADLAAALRGAPGFGAWPSAPQDPEALDRLALRATAAVCGSRPPSRRAALWALAVRAWDRARNSCVVPERLDALPFPSLVETPVKGGAR